MVNKLTNQEIAKVFAMYWGRYFIYSGSISVKRRICGVSLLTLNISDWHDTFIPERCKLLLKPLFDITDEDAAEIMLQIFTDELPKEGRSRVGKTYIDYVYLNKQIHASELNDISEVYDIQNAYIYQDLIHKGYAVPLYFGFDHWANGKTAIELGIAFDEKTLNK